MQGTPFTVACGILEYLLLDIMSLFDYSTDASFMVVILE